MWSRLPPLDSRLENFSVFKSKPARLTCTCIWKKYNRPINSLSPRLETRTTQLETQKTRLETRYSKFSSFEDRGLSRVVRVSSDCQLTFDRYCSWLNVGVKAKSPIAMCNFNFIYCFKTVYFYFSCYICVLLQLSSQVKDFAVMSSILVALFLMLFQAQSEFLLGALLINSLVHPVSLLVFFVLWPFFVSVLFPCLVFRVWGASPSIWKDQQISRCPNRLLGIFLITFWAHTTA